MADYVIAKYIRLSVEDAKTDSMSIENQRLLLDRHIAELDFPGAEILEFVDNGYTGTNFERPDVQKMLELVRSGAVNCIVVKDFSRFGRNAIETGYFIERVFPLFQVRFISVSDHFDSADYEGDTGGMEIAFKFLMHEYYSKDLSKKIRSARHEKMRRGEAVTENTVYGYRLNQVRQMVIDEPAAEVVRMIFRFASEGSGLVEIERRLYVEKRPTPGEHKKLRKGATGFVPSCIWNKSAILQILHNEQYLGTYVAGKHKNIEVAGKQISVDSSEWIRIPDHHPAIIEQAIFDAVDARFKQKSKPLRKRRDRTVDLYTNVKTRPLKSKVFCGCCGCAMQLSITRNPCYHCYHTRAVPDAECHSLRISESELTKMLYKLISKQARAVMNTEDVSDVTELDSRLIRQSEHGERIERLRDDKRCLYEQLVLGEIDVEGYKAENARLDSEITRLTKIYEALSDKLDSMAKDKALAAARRKMAAAVKSEKKLTRALVELLIEKVLVFPGERVEVQWRFAEFFDVRDGGEWIVG